MKAERNAPLSGGPATASSPGPTDAPPPNRGAVESHLREMLPHARLLPVGELEGRVEVGCVDGRNHGCVIGAPGGNAGLFLVLAAALEALRGKPLGDAEVEGLFRDYLDHFGSFYLHSDLPAARRLLEAVGAPPVEGDGRPGLEAFLGAPPPELRPRLLEALVEPEQVGCGHLARLLRGGNPEAAIRPALVRALLRTFFRTLWSGDARLRFEVLEGEHHEEGVLRVHAAANDLLATCPHHGPREFFVLHPDAVAWLETLHALFAARAGWIPPRLSPQLVELQHRLGEAALSDTLAELAPGLPLFDVHLAPGHPLPGVSVQDAGVVPNRRF
jgi:hypothetical protein